MLPRGNKKSPWHQLGRDKDGWRAVRTSRASAATRLADLARYSAQIHIDLRKPYEKQIQIFSKSHRDSSEDRAAVHP